MHLIAISFLLKQKRLLSNYGNILIFLILWQNTHLKVDRIYHGFCEFNAWFLLILESTLVRQNVTIEKIRGRGYLLHYRSTGRRGGEGQRKTEGQGERGTGRERDRESEIDREGKTETGKQTMYRAFPRILAQFPTFSGQALPPRHSRVTTWGQRSQKVSFMKGHFISQHIPI